MGNLTADANFKAVFRNKNVALKFMKLLMPELEREKRNELMHYEVVGAELDEDRMMSTEEIDRYINIDEMENIEYLPDSKSDKMNKAIIHDVLFNYRSEIIPTRNNIMTIDLEMENQRQDYPIAGRGTYYAAKLHSQTLERGQNYNASNKVYSIWLLNYENWHDEIPIRSIYQALTYTKRGSVELIGEKKETKGYDLDSDGLEVVYIELPKLDNSNIDDTLKDMLLSIRDGNDIIEVIREICGLKQKEAEIMETNLRAMDIKVNPYIEIGVERGKQEGRREGRREGRHEGMCDVARKMISLGNDIDTIKKLTDLTEDEIKELMRVN